MTKPHVSGRLNDEVWSRKNKSEQLAMFSKWSVAWEENAACGHEMCGVDWMVEEFATWPDAIKFALDLTST